MNEILEFLHLFTLALTLTAVIATDAYVTPWLRGTKKILSQKIVSLAHTWITAGLIGMIVTGFALFLPIREYLVFESLTFVPKMLFVLALVLNSFVIGAFMNIAIQKSFADTTTQERIILFVSGTVSTIAWVGATLSGFFLFG